MRLLKKWQQIVDHVIKNLEINCLVLGEDYISTQDISQIEPLKNSTLSKEFLRQ